MLPTQSSARTFLPPQSISYQDATRYQRCKILSWEDGWLDRRWYSKTNHAICRQRGREGCYGLYVFRPDESRPYHKSPLRGHTLQQMADGGCVVNKDYRPPTSWRTLPGKWNFYLSKSTIWIRKSTFNVLFLSFDSSTHPLPPFGGNIVFREIVLGVVVFHRKLIKEDTFPELRVCLASVFLAAIIIVSRFPTKWNPTPDK